MVGDYNMSRTVSWWGVREAAGEDEGSGREGCSTPWEGAQIVGLLWKL